MITSRPLSSVARVPPTGRWIQRVWVVRHHQNDGMLAFTARVVEDVLGTDCQPVREVGGVFGREQSSESAQGRVGLSIAPSLQDDPGVLGRRVRLN